MLKTLWRRGLLVLGAAAWASGAGAAPAAAPAGHPALWEVADRDTTVYLFGTIHLLPHNYAWQTSAFQKAVGNSQALVIETIIDLKHPEFFVGELARLSLSPVPLPPILDRVSPDKRAALEAAIVKAGAQPAQLQRLKTWAVAFQLIGLQYSRFGLQGDEGPETILRQAFTAIGKPVGQLETNAEQLSFFDTLPEKAQRALLEGAIEAPADTRGQFDQMLAAWARGDVKAIAKTFNEDLAGSPELMDSLLKRRNANWRRWIEQRMASPGSALVAVGAGHLAGRDSVIDLLQRDGWRVRRIQ